MNILTRKTNTMKNTLILLLALLVPTFAGCGYDAEDLCDDGCDCEGCSDFEYDECVDRIEDAEREADYQGCLDQHDDLMACLNDEFRCTGDGRVDIDGCNPEWERYGNCCPGCIGQWFF